MRPATSDAAVAAATGKTWPQWFGALDDAGAERWNHKQIVRHLREGYPLTGWWRQMIAVTYEQARGLRDKHEQSDGYQIQRQRTIHVDIDAAWRAWADESIRQRWLPEADKVVIRGERPDKREVRLDWVDGRTRVLLGFRPAGEGKCAAGVQHSKLPDAQAAEEAKANWSRRLETLRDLLESAQQD